MANRGVLHLALPANGKVNLADRELFLKDALQHEGHQIAITIKRYRQNRTTEQNAYYHVVVEFLREVMNEQGNDYEHDEVHHLLRGMFLSERAIIVNRIGECKETTIARSTTELDTKEFTQYIEEIRLWAIDFWGVEIPTPPETLKTP